MPAPAVIPAPIAYIKVVAVKKLVVGFWRFVEAIVLGSPDSVALRLLGSSWMVGWVGFGPSDSPSYSGRMGTGLLFLFSGVECALSSYLFF